MNHSPRVRRIAKWSVAVVCMLMVEAWVISLVAAVVYRPPGHKVVYSLQAGCATVIWWTSRSAPIRGNSEVIDLSLLHGWSIQSLWFAMHWLPTYKNYPAPIGISTLVIPLWVPITLVGLPTAYLFWRDRSPPPGHCRECGYDLQGNVSGVCPECGAGVETGTEVETGT